jgi:AcrR family transcriptional regulator
MSVEGRVQSEGTAAGTVDELLSIAERLFAEKGVENVALTQIVAASSQKNRSALHYHFGSRAGLLSALLDRRLEPINVRRDALLDALPANATPLHIVRAAIAALGQTVVEEFWGADYLRILAQVTFPPQLLGKGAVARSHLSRLRRTRALLEEAIPEVPQPLMAQRLTWLIDSVVFAMARWVRDTPPSQGTARAMNQLIEDLAVYGTAGLTAPLTPSRTPLKEMTP